MTACKHGNGRDYWIITPGSNNNEFYKFLLTPDTILGPFIQFIGHIISDSFDLAYSKFSPDGSKYATSTLASLIVVLDFDRCSGEFSNPITLYHNAGVLQGPPQAGCTGQDFSPNGRFLYAADVSDLTQYDLWSGNPQDSSQIWIDSISDDYGMDMLQLAPNGKLYGGTFNGGLYALHVVNYPDSLGTNCDFVYGGQPTLSGNSMVLPNMINYSLGALQGSPCDTIPTSITEIRTKNQGLRIMPNPADKYLYVEMGAQGNYEFDLLNEMGQVLQKKETLQVDIFDTENLASGVYLLRVTDKNATNILTQKVVVQH